MTPPNSELQTDDQPLNSCIVGQTNHPGVRLRSVVVYFPGDAPPMVASADAGKQMPPDMVEALGQPQVVTAAQEIFEAIMSLTNGSRR